MKKLYIPDSVAITLNVLATVAIAVVGPLVTLVAIVILSMMGFGEVYTRIVILLCLPVFPLLIPVIWSKRRKKSSPSCWRRIFCCSGCFSASRPSPCGTRKA